MGQKKQKTTPLDEEGVACGDELLSAATVKDAAEVGKNMGRS